MIKDQCCDIYALLITLAQGHIHIAGQTVSDLRAAYTVYISEIRALLVLEVQFLQVFRYKKHTIVTFDSQRVSFEQLILYIS
jgi:hypothetical protein